MARPKKMTMCKAIAQDMENKKPSKAVSVNQMASFINKNYSLNDVTEMYNKLANQK
jgi:hypothetical protein